MLILDEDGVGESVGIFEFFKFPVSKVKKKKDDEVCCVDLGMPIDKEINSDGMLRCRMLRTWNV